MTDPSYEIGTVFKEDKPEIIWEVSDLSIHNEKVKYKLKYIKGLRKELDHEYISERILNKYFTEIKTYEVVTSV